MTRAAGFADAAFLDTRKGRPLGSPAPKVTGAGSDSEGA